MKYLNYFEKFLNESIVKYDQSIIKQIIDFNNQLLKDIPEYYIYQIPMQNEIEEYKSFSKELSKNIKVIEKDLKNVLYQSKDIQKGVLIHKALLEHNSDSIDDTLIEKVNKIIESGVSETFQFKCQINFIPFVRYCFFNDKFLEINGFLDQEPTYRLKKQYESNREILFVSNIYFNTGTENNVEETITHEMMHLTQFINSLCLNIFKLFSKNTNNLLNKSIEDIYTDLYENSTSSKFYSVGMTKKKYLDHQDYISSTTDLDKYMDNPVEYKTHMHDITKKYFNRALDKKDINKIASDILNDKNVKMINVPNKQKISDVLRLLNLFKNNN